MRPTPHSPGGVEPSPLLAVANLDAWYGLSRVLFGVNLQVGQGEVVALLGRNGAGKSTTLRATMGLVPRLRGRVLLRGEELLGKPPYQICGKGIGFVPQERRIFPDLTVRENLEVGRRRPMEERRAWSEERIVGLFPTLGHLLGRLGGSLSGGEQRMLAIARSLMGNPGLLLLDEPSEGLAPVVVQTLAAQIRQLKQTGLAVLMSEQNLRFATHVSDRAYIMEKGRICHEGPMRELATDEAVRKRYFMV
jgi:branched-chain amino acid transport system ATP-binding protein